MTRHAFFLRALALGASILLAACARTDGEGREGPMPPAAEVPVPAAPAKKEAPLTFGNLHNGQASFYRATGKGNCSFDADPDLMVAAINSKDYASAALCGAYVAVSGPRGKVTVRIVDRCPGCKEGGLDLSAEAFSKIAEPKAGRARITWQIVAAPISGPLAYRYKEGASRYWIAIQVRNHRWPVASLEIQPKGSTAWLPLERRAYNYFVHAKRIEAWPVRVRTTAVTGAVVEDVLPEPRSGLLVQGAAQFE